MASNKHLIEDRSTLLKNKLDKLSASLQRSASAAHFQTKEEYLFEAVRIMRSFYRDMTRPQLPAEATVFSDSLPDPEVYNDLWERLLNDLIIVFTELENIETMMFSNFNFITTESNRLNARTKSVASKLGDYILYSLSALQDIIFFKDSFNDLTKIDLNSGLLNEDQLDIGQDEGIITLPADLTKDSRVSVVGLPIINPNSNGDLGNNHEIGTAFNGDLSVILDSNPDTWVEYERVTPIITENPEPLVLDLTLNLGEPKIINRIVVNPNNFGTKTTIEVAAIDTSTDGSVYTSIKDDIPIAGFTTEDEENVFTLAPSTSKYAGQGIYTFTPRKVKFVRFVFKQNEPYIIQTSTGTRLRYAIGLRDIDLKAITFKQKGELISNLFSLNDEVRKVLIDSNQIPTDTSELVSVQWFVSPNDGAEWHELQPKTFNVLSGIESALPEILNFNGPEPDAISTPAPVRKVRVKVAMSRNKDAFAEGTSALVQNKLNRSELHAVPNASPFQLLLEQNPIDGTVSVIDPLFGSCGLPEVPYVMTVDARSQQSFILPEMFKTFNWPMKKVKGGNGRWYTKRMDPSEFMHLEVAGEEWTHPASGLSNYSFSSGNPSATKYFNFNRSNGRIYFGNNQNATQVPDRAQVSFWFEAERVTPNSITDNHVAQLAFPTSNNKDGLKIERWDPAELHLEVVPKDATVIRLAHQDITINNGENIPPAMLEMGFTNQKSFINGISEIENSTDWSLDSVHGIIYTGGPTPSDDDYTITYEWQPKYKLLASDWDWVEDGVLRNKVSIKETAWKTQVVKSLELTTTSGIKVLHLPNMSLVKGTVIPKATASGITASGTLEPFFKETEFINGIDEFGGAAVKKATETIPLLVPGGSDVAEFTLRHSISTVSGHIVQFLTHKYFNAAPETSLGAVQAGSPGDWYADRATSTIYVKLPSSTSVLDTTERITYWYDNPITKDEGLYSVDYENGIIYLQRAIDPLGDGDWTVTVDYEWTDFRVYYRIARALDKSDYKVDITNNKIEISEKEILQHILIPKPGREFISPYYLVNYDYVARTKSDIQELEPYFTPVVKDYALNVLTKGNIF